MPTVVDCGHLINYLILTLKANTSSCGIKTRKSEHFVMFGLLQYGSHNCSRTEIQQIFQSCNRADKEQKLHRKAFTVYR